MVLEAMNCAVSYVERLSQFLFEKIAYVLSERHTNIRVETPRPAASSTFMTARVVLNKISKEFCISLVEYGLSMKRTFLVTQVKQPRYHLDSNQSCSLISDSCIW